MTSTVAPIRRVFRIVNGGTPTSHPENWGGDIAWATPIDLAKCNGGKISATRRSLTLAGLDSGSNAVPKASLIVSSRAPIGYVAETTRAMAFNQGCKGLIPIQDVDIRFFRYQFSAMDGQFQSSGQGATFLELSADALASSPIAVPSPSAQRVIADYLDSETTRIDALIANKRRMIHLLEERWRELRRVRVLRGLDPVSGGGLDEPWPEMNLGVLIELQRGHDLPSDDRIDGTIPVVSSGGVSGSHNIAIADGPGVVTGRYGTVGEVFFVNTPYWPLNTTLYVKNFRGNDHKWIYHLLASIPLDIDSQKSAVGGINRNIVGLLRVPRPSVPEQRAIARYLDEAEGLSLETLRRLADQIHLLVERRQALITAVVTRETPGIATA